MNLPNLPTDNLYKFLSLFGLVLIVVGLFLTYDYPNRLYEKLYELESKEKTLNVSNNYSAKYELEAEIKKLSLKVENLGYLLYLFIAVTFIGVILSSYGFYQWYYKLQIHSDEIVKNEAEKYKLEAIKRRAETTESKSIKIHHLQFEKEFEVYKELWEALTELRSSTLSLRPLIENVDISKSRTFVNEEKISNFKKSYEHYWTIYQNNKPFYFKDVYLLADQLSKKIRLEYYGFRSEIENSKTYYLEEYWDKVEQNQNDIIEKIESICEVIRIRIGLLELT